MDPLKRKVQQGLNKFHNAVANNVVQKALQVATPAPINLARQVIKSQPVQQLRAQAPQMANKVFNSPVGKYALNQPLLQMPGIGPKPKIEFSPTVGDYVGGQIIKPLKTAYNKNAKPLDRVMGGIQAGVSLTPSGSAFNILSGGTSGALKALRTKQDVNQSIAKGMTNPMSDIGGEGLGIKNPALALAVDVATGNPKAALKKASSFKAAGKAFKTSGMRDVVYKKTTDLIAHNIDGLDRNRIDFYKKQIKEGKFVAPIYIVKEGAKHGVEDGKHRLQAYRELGYKYVPTTSDAARAKRTTQLADDLNFDIPKMGISGKPNATKAGLYDTGKYYIRNGLNELVKAENAKPVNLDNGIDAFSHTFGKGTGVVISEAKTGMQIAKGKTEKEAIANAQKAFRDLKGITPQQLIERQLKSLESGIIKKTDGGIGRHIVGDLNTDKEAIPYKEVNRFGSHRIMQGANPSSVKLSGSRMGAKPTSPQIEGMAARESLVGKSQLSRLSQARAELDQLSGDGALPLGGSKSRVAQQPKGVTLSKSALERGLTTPQKGSDIAVRTQAAIKRDVKAQLESERQAIRDFEQNVLGGPDQIPFNQQEVDRIILNSVTQKRTLKGRINPLNDVDPNIKKAVQEWDAENKVAQVKGNKIAFEQSSGLDPELEYKILKYSQNPSAKTAQALGLTPQDIESGREIMKKSAEFNDDIFKRANAAGIDVNYLKNHIFQTFKETPGQIDELLRARGLSGKPGFANRRSIPNFMEGEKLGLTPGYTTFGQLNAVAEQELNKAIANKKLFDQLIKSNKVLPSNTPNLPADWQTINAPFFPQAARVVGKGQTVITQYKASPELARTLNNIFGTESQSLGSTILRGGAKVSGVLQDVALSGGVGPLNFYGVGQLVKEASAGRVVKPLGAFMRAFIPGASKNFEKANIQTIEEMASQGLGSYGVGNYQNLYKNVKYSRGLREFLGDTWSKVINEPTFKKFQYQLQVEFFKDAKNSALNNGLSPEEAIKVAGDATKNFYGIGNNLGRSKDFENSISAVFLAPKYRESLINIYGNLLKGVGNPSNWGKAEYAGIQRLAAGMAITFGLYNAAQYKATGNFMWDNPPGKEGELVMPIGDPKDGKFISIPWMPGFTAMPRRIAGTGAALIKGDPQEAIKQFSSLFSIPVSKAGELASNSDYFGQPIYGEGVTPQQTLAYAVGSFAPGYGRAALNVATGKSTPAYGLIQALELPVKVGSFPNKYYTAKNEIEKGITRDQKPTWDYLVKSSNNGGPDAEGKAQILLNNDWALEKYKALKLASNPNDALYSRSTQDIKAYLAYQLLDDTQKKAELRVVNPWIPQVQFQSSQDFYNTMTSKNQPTPGYDQNSFGGKLAKILVAPKKVTETNTYEAPTRSPIQSLSPEQVKIASAYTALPKGSAQRKTLLAQNPWLKAYWDANEKYYANNPSELKGPVADVLKELGISTELNSGGSSYGSGSRSYLAKVSAKKAPSFKVKKAPKFRFKKVASKNKKAPKLKVAKYKAPKKIKLA